MWDLEFGDFLLAGVSGRIRRDVRGSAVGVDMLFAGVLHVHFMNAVDDLIGVDLQAFISATQELAKLVWAVEA